MISRPVLRYHGGKYRLAPWVISHFPPHRVYVEPFGGGASVLMLKERTYAEVYNDLDGEIVNVFRILRDPESAGALEHALRLTPFSRTEFEEGYQPATDPLERARRTIVKSFMGFGSAAIHDPRPTGMRTRASVWKAPTGFRADASRSGTTPAHDWRNYPDHIGRFCDRLSGVVIENRPAETVIRAHDREDALFYVDPPYVHSSRAERSGERGKGYAFEMNDAAHEELSEVLHSVGGGSCLVDIRAICMTASMGDGIDSSASTGPTRRRSEPRFCG